VGSFKIVHGFFILGQRDPRGKPEASINEEASAGEEVVQN